ncbi:MAG: sn-glycerol-1-phosphate dehydrogenase, partial [Rhodospirillales bacterium]|nr:sn-glycerol-1-phosphate dehydrogenase [Rhodospirillales bacterium]
MLNQKHTQDATIRSAVAQSRQIDAVMVESGAIRHVPELLSNHLEGSRLFVVADDNTMAAAGKELVESCGNRGYAVDLRVFPGTPRLKGTVENAETLIPELKKTGGIPVAVGSGVINDLVKYAAFQVDRTYVSVATAASMDGYASAGSPLTIKGFKHTIPCAAPRMMIADLDVISSAPKEMASWGYGDLAGKIAAGADWLIADALGIEKIDDCAWPLVQDDLRSWLSDPAGVASGDAGATGALFTGLVAAGVAMEVHGSSRPASGADHQVAHLWEMDGLEHGGLPVSHGTCVAIGTLTILSLYEWLLARNLRGLDTDRIIAGRRRIGDLAAEIEARFPSPAIAERALKETQAKYVEDDELAARIALIREIWPELRGRLADYLMTFDELAQMLRSTGVATEPSGVGISRAYHRDTLIGS